MPSQARRRAIARVPLKFALLVFASHFAWASAFAGVQPVPGKGAGACRLLHDHVHRVAWSAGRRRAASPGPLPLLLVATLNAAIKVPPHGAALGVCGDVDPVLASLMMHAARNIRGFDVGSLVEASAGLQVWNKVLKRGRLPVDADFVRNNKWPKEPLFSRFVDVLADLQLPRFVLRHPDTASAVLLSMLQLTIDFIEQSQTTADQQVDLTLPPQTSHTQDTDSISIADEYEEPAPSAELEALAEELAGDMRAQWGGVIGGVHTLEKLFGTQHGLLDASGQGGGGGGFGLHDGVWAHSGW